MHDKGHLDPVQLCRICHARFWIDWLFQQAKQDLWIRPAVRRARQPACTCIAMPCALLWAAFR